jgi:hypothetical protein
MWGWSWQWHRNRVRLVTPWEGVINLLLLSTLCTGLYMPRLAYIYLHWSPWSSQQTKLIDVTKPTDFLVPNKPTKPNWRYTPSVATAKHWCHSAPCRSLPAAVVVQLLHDTNIVCLLCTASWAFDRMEVAWLYGTVNWREHAYYSDVHQFTTVLYGTMLPCSRIWFSQNMV